MTLKSVISKLASPLGIILFGAFLLRAVGVGYGLPLTVVADETPFTFAALKMLQLKTLIPALHSEAFQSILPYPPYLSYLLLVPFAAILGVQYLLWQGSAELFQANLVADLSAFFVTARLLSALLGTLSVYLVYKIAERLFRSRVASLAAAFLLGTSLLHIALSMVGRNWIPVSFIFLLIFFLLTREWSMQRRYVWAFVVAGIGLGVSSLCAFFSVFIGLYYLLFDVHSLKQALHDLPRHGIGVLIFFALAILPSLLYQSGNAFLGAVTLSEPKTFLGLLMSPWSALSLIVYSEPVLVGGFALGISMLAFAHRRLASLIAAWSLFYIALFYFLFRFDARFLVPLLPLFALAGGYAVGTVWNTKMRSIAIIALAIPLVIAVQVSSLAFQGDTREHARAWVLERLSPEDKILVFSSAMHIPTKKAAVEELRSVEPSAIRSADEADEVFDRNDVPYALNNLTMFSDKEFIATLPGYAKRGGYTHVLIEPRSLVLFPEMAEAFASISEGADLAAHFGGLGEFTSLYNSAFTEPFTSLFSGRSLGPDILIYRFTR